METPYPISVQEIINKQYQNREKLNDYANNWNSSYDKTKSALIGLTHTPDLGGSNHALNVHHPFGEHRHAQAHLDWGRSLGLLTIAMCVDFLFVGINPH